MGRAPSIWIYFDFRRRCCGNFWVGGKEEDEEGDSYSENAVCRVPHVPCNCVRSPGEVCWEFYVKMEMESTAVVVTPPDAVGDRPYANHQVESNQVPLRTLKVSNMMVNKL